MTPIAGAGVRPAALRAPASDRNSVGEREM